MTLEIVGSTSLRDDPSDTEFLRAVRIVLLYTVADVFDLTEDELVWTSYRIDEALKPFERCKRTAIPAAVRYEIISGEYSKRLNSRQYVRPQSEDGTTATVDLLDWANVLSSIVTNAYSAQPLVQSGFIGQVAGVLSTLGVGNKKSPRASKYLPNAVRYAINT